MRNIKKYLGGEDHSNRTHGTTSTADSLRASA